MSFCPAFSHYRKSVFSQWALEFALHESYWHQHERESIQADQHETQDSGKTQIPEQASLVVPEAYRWYQWLWRYLADRHELSANEMNPVGTHSGTHCHNDNWIRIRRLRTRTVNVIRSDPAMTWCWGWPYHLAWLQGGRWDDYVTCRYWRTATGWVPVGGAIQLNSLGPLNTCDLNRSVILCGCL